MISAFSSLHELRTRGSAAVAVLVDVAADGGSENVSRMAFHLRAGGVRVYVVRQGDDLETALDARKSLASGRYS